MDWTPFQVVGTAFFGMIATVAVGLYTGRTARIKATAEAESELEKAQADIQLSEMKASKERIEFIREEANRARIEMREQEREYASRIKTLSEDRDRHWRERQAMGDIASYHFGLVTSLMHLFNGLMFVLVQGEELNDGKVQQRVYEAVKRVQDRLKGYRIPVTLRDVPGVRDTESEK